jgi:hypothetical protein
MPRLLLSCLCAFDIFGMKILMPLTNASALLLCTPAVCHDLHV